MSELRILFQRSGDSLTYRLVTSAGTDAGPPLPFEPFLTEADYKDLRWYLEEYMELPMGGATVRAARVELAIREWGQRLFDLVFGIGDHRDLYRDFLEDPPPRLLT